MHRQHLILVILLLIFTFFAYIFFLKIPKIWPDEALHVDIVSNILKEGRLGTDLWKGLLIGVDRYGFQYPPLYFYLVAEWFKIAGNSIASLRFLSFIIGTVTLLLLYNLAKLILLGGTQVLNKQIWWLAVLPISLLVFDQDYLKSSLIGRPEIVVLFMGTLSLLMYLDGTEKKLSPFLRRVFILTSGLLSSLAVLNHYPGIIFPVTILLFMFYKEKLSLVKNKEFYLFILSFCIPLIIWVITIWSHINIFLEQMALQKPVKDIGIGYLRLIFNSTAWEMKLLYLTQIFIIWEFATFSFVYKKANYILLTILLIASWIVSFLWKSEFSAIFPVPFVYISLVALLYTTYSQKFSKASFLKQKFSLYAGLFILVLTLNILIQIKNLSQLGGANYSYDKFTQDILATIPDNKTVLLNSIPDAYFAFKNGRGNKLYEFPMLVTDPKDYLAVLNQVDFVIYNISGDMGVAGDVLQKYLRKNTKQIYQIGGTNQYSAQIIEFISVEQRQIK